MIKYNSETEQRILDAATRIFVEKGWDGARMSDIAENAGLNKALLHYYFRSKERLYQTIFSREIGEFFRTITQSLNLELPIREFLREFVYTYISGLAQNPKIPRFMIWELGKGGKMIKPVLNEIFMKKEDSVPKVILAKFSLAGVNEEIREIDPIQLLISMLGICIFPFIAQPIIEEVFEGVRIMEPEFIEKRKSEVFDMIWNGIKK